MKHRQTLKQQQLAVSEYGQMMIELCAVTPVILMMAVVIIDGLSFTALSSRFDHLAAQVVLAVAASPQGTDFDAATAASSIQTQLQEQLANDHGQVSISAEEVGATCTFNCQISVVPWPLSSGGLNVFGMAVPTQLEHSFSFAVRPYVIGAL